MDRQEQSIAETVEGNKLPQTNKQPWPDCGSSSKTIRLSTTQNKMFVQNKIGTLQQQHKKDNHHYHSKLQPLVDSAKQVNQIKVQSFHYHTPTPHQNTVLKPSCSVKNLCMKQLDVYQDLKEQRRQINYLISDTHQKLSLRDNDLIELKSQILQEQINKGKQQFHTIGAVKGMTSPAARVRYEAQNELVEMDVQQSAARLREIKITAKSRNTENLYQRLQFNTYQNGSIKINEINGDRQFNQMRYPSIDFSSMKENNRVMTGQTTVNNMPGLRFDSNASENRFMPPRSNHPLLLTQTPDAAQNQAICNDLMSKVDSPLPRFNTGERSPASSKVQKHVLPPRGQLVQKPKYLASENGKPLQQIQIRKSAIHKLHKSPPANVIQGDKDTDLMHYAFINQDQPQTPLCITPSPIKYNNILDQPVRSHPKPAFDPTKVSKDTNQIKTQSFDNLSNSKLIEEINKRINEDEDFNQILVSKLDKEGYFKDTNIKTLDQPTPNTIQNSNNVSNVMQRSNNAKRNEMPSSKQIDHVFKQMNTKKLELEIQNEKQKRHSMMVENQAHDNQIKFDEEAHTPKQNINQTESHMYQCDDIVMNQTIKSEEQFKFVKGNTVNKEQGIEEETKENDRHQKQQQSCKKGINQSPKAKIKTTVKGQFNKILKQSLNDINMIPEEQRQQLLTKINQKLLQEQVSESSGYTDGELQNQAIALIVKQQLQEILGPDFAKQEAVKPLDSIFKPQYNIQQLTNETQIIQSNQVVGHLELQQNKQILTPATVTQINSPQGITKINVQPCIKLERIDKQKTNLVDPPASPSPMSVPDKELIQVKVKLFHNEDDSKKCDVIRPNEQTKKSKNSSESQKKKDENRKQKSRTSPAAGTDLEKKLGSKQKSNVSSRDASSQDKQSPQLGEKRTKMGIIEENVENSTVELQSNSQMSLQSNRKRVTIYHLDMKMSMISPPSETVKSVSSVTNTFSKSSSSQCSSSKTPSCTPISIGSTTHKFKNGEINVMPVSSTSVFQNPAFEVQTENQNIFSGGSKGNHSNKNDSKDKKKEKEKIKDKIKNSPSSFNESFIVNLPYVNKQSISPDLCPAQIPQADNNKKTESKKPPKPNQNGLKLPAQKSKKSLSRRGSVAAKIFGNQNIQLVSANLNFESSVGSGQYAIEMPKVMPLKLNLLNTLDVSKSPADLLPTAQSSQRRQTKFLNQNLKHPQTAKDEMNYDRGNSKGSGIKSSLSSRRGSILLQKLEDGMKPNLVNHNSIENKKAQKSSVKESAQKSSVKEQEQNKKSSGKDIVYKNNFDMDAFRQGDTRRYYIPSRYIEKQNHGKKSKLELEKGIVTIKWKKGKESIGIGIGDANPADVFTDQDRKSKIKLKKNGYGKFQTYANFLKGEEKEQYEKYLENKRKND